MFSGVKGFCRAFGAAVVVGIVFISGTALAQTHEFFRVQRVVDGDTVILEKAGRVRLIGVDTPETKHPNKPVQAFGKEASQFLTDLLTGQKVRLEHDQNRADRYGRTLAYVYMEDGTFVNEKIIAEGYGYAYTRHPFRYLERFRALERAAREQKKGLWGDAPKEAAKVVSIQPAVGAQGKTAGSVGCDPRKTCSRIHSCEEAMFLMKECGLGRLDGDKDGVPCEKICGTGR